MSDDPTASADENSKGDERVERRSRLVPASAVAIFDLLADPAQHATIDGSGTVQAGADENPERLSLGAKFGMKMRRGLPYRITNEVVEFDEPTLIAWRHMGGHVWRYRLREVDGGTEVTEEFDWRPSRAPWLLQLMRAPQANARSLEATLDRLADHFAESST
jgi:hypothetical protein